MSCVCLMNNDSTWQNGREIGCNDSELFQPPIMFDCSSLKSIYWLFLSPLICHDLNLAIEICQPRRTKIKPNTLKERFTQKWKCNHYLLVPMENKSRVKFRCPQNILLELHGKKTALPLLNLLGECCSTLLLWSSRNVFFWTAKLP